MSVPRKLILHIGQPKAGSTSIQNYLEAQRSALLQQGILFPQSVFLRQNPFDLERTPGHLKLLADLRAGTLEAFEQELETHKNCDVIISIENLFSDQPDSVFQALAAYFQGWDIHVVAVLRPQLDALRSRYVENIMSGFSRRVTSFEEFVRDVFEAGALDYAARLRHIQEVLGAASVRAVRFLDPQKPLVPRFLQAAGIPVGDPQQAGTIHSNHREKPAFLIEGKRRLNMLTGALNREQCLEFENRLRDLAQEMIQQGANGQNFAPSVPLSADERDALQVSNQSLKALCELEGKLKLEEAPRRVCAPDERAIQDLMRKGMDLLSKMVTSDPEQLGLSDWDWQMVNRLFAQYRTSLHLGSVQTALLAAMLPDHQSWLFLPSGLAAYQALAAHDGLSLPGQLMTFAVGAGELKAPRQLAACYSLAGSELVVVGPDVDLDPMTLMSKGDAPAALLVMGSQRALSHQGLPPGLRMTCSDRCILLERPEAAAPA